MGRGNKIILLAILLVIIAGSATYLLMNRHSKKYSPVALAMPDNFVMCYQGKNLKEGMKRLEENSFFKTLSQNISIASFEKKFNTLDSVLNSDETLAKMLIGKNVIVSVHVTSATDYQLLYSVESQDGIGKKEVENTFQKYYAGSKVFQHTFEGETIFDISANGNQNICSYVFQDGILSLSANTVLVEDAVKAFRTHRNKTEGVYEKLVAAEGTEKIAVNYAALPGLTGVFFNEDNLFTDLLKTLDGYGIYDVKTDDNYFKLDGIVNLNENQNIWQPVLNQKPVAVAVSSVLPSSTAFLADWGVPDFGKWYADNQKIAQSSTQKDYILKQKADFESRNGISIDNSILPLFDGEWCLSTTEIPAYDSKIEKLFCVKAADTGNSLNAIQSVEELITKHNSTRNEPVIYRNYLIQKSGIGESFPVIFAGILNYAPEYWARIGNYYFFGESPEQLQRCIDSYLESQVLEKSTGYKGFISKLPSTSNFIFYCDPARALNIFRQNCRQGYQQKLEENVPTYKIFNSTGFQLSSNSNSFYSVVSADRSGGVQKSSDQVWTVKLESPALTKPYVVTNPVNHQPEIMIQDSNLNLYLLSNSGNIVWKQRMDEQIMGEIHQLDLYKNGDLEFLFSTRSQVYMMTHEGTIIGGYPLRLAGTTSTGISLFDFSDSRDYTYIIGLDQSRVYGFSGNGRPLPGWSPKSLDSKAVGAIESFVSGNRNCLYTITKTGSLYVWDPTGKDLMKPVQLKAPFKYNLKVVTGANLSDCRFLGVDSTNTLFEVTPPGTIRKKHYPGFNSAAFFDYFDSDGNGKPEIQLTANRKIISYEKDTIPQWKLETPEELVNPPQFIYFQGQSFIGFTSPNARLVYLYSRTGGVYPGFPVSGTGVFTIIKQQDSDGLELVTAGEGNAVYAYRLGR